MADNRTKGLLGVIVTVLIAGLVVFSLFKSVTTEKSLRQQKEKELASKIELLTQKDLELADLVKQRAEVDTKLKALQANLESVVKQYDDKISTLNSNLDSMVKDNESLTKERDLSLKKITELSSRIQELEADKYDLVTKVKTLQAGAAVAASPASPQAVSDSAAASAKESQSEAEAVPLGKIVVQRKTGRPAEVQQVDAVYGFVIVNAGTEEGLKKDTILNIARNNRLVAKAVVEKSRENVAAAVILPEWSQGEVRVGDTVTKV